MKEILFVLLIAFAEPHDDRPGWELEEFPGMTNEWIGVDTKNQVARHHYKAIIFYDEKALDYYLRTHWAHGSLLIDRVCGKVVTVNQFEKNAYKLRGQFQDIK